VNLVFTEGFLPEIMYRNWYPSLASFALLKVNPDASNMIQFCWMNSCSSEMKSQEINVRTAL
jgi:hypothetical protein